MRLSDLKKLFKDELSVKEFRALIKTEVDAMLEHDRLIKKQKKIGTTYPPITLLSNGDDFIEITEKEVVFLCKAYLEDLLTVSDLDYITDALTMAECVRIASEEVFEMIEAMNTPSVNGVFTKERAQYLIEKFTD